MAELITIARPYAEAAFRLARDENALAAWSDMLRFMASVIADPQIARALDNPKLGTGEKEAMLLSVAGDRLSALGRNFVRVLIEADRATLLPQIAGLFEALKAGMKSGKPSDRTRAAAALLAFVHRGLELTHIQTAQEDILARIEALVGEDLEVGR